MQYDQIHATPLRRLLILWVALAVLVVVSPVEAQEYRGAEWCSNCHATQFNWWQVSGHPWKLTEADVARNRNMPLPEGFTWDDISYVIGGYKWKIRFMGPEGYIVTTVDTETGPVDGMNQYNMQTGGWVDYHPGERKPYNCGRCHTTGWVADEDWETDDDLSDNQDGLPGIHGTFAFGGVQCEQCHGIGFEMAVDRSKELCGACHVRGDPATIPAKGGFIRHHEQYNEQLASPHRSLECVSCHNPHQKAEFSIHTTCGDCHTDVASAYYGSTMDVRGVDCVDCHMPFASKSAVAFGPYQGDVRTHLFAINTAKNGRLFTDDGKFVRLDGDGRAAVTLDFACQSCHTDKSSGWIQGKAKNFHQRGGPSPAPAPPARLTRGGRGSR